MVYHLVLYKLKPEVTPEKLDEMLRLSRMYLLKIPEALHVRSGKKIDPACEWPFFVSVELESLDKLRMYQDDPFHTKFREEVLKPHTTESMTLNYETEPGRDVRKS